VIRQTITCDTCGIERKQANHWFEAFEHEGELRIRGLAPTKTTRPGLKHLCGQTCLHRLVDDFLAGNLASRMFGAHEEAKAPTDFAQVAASAETLPDLHDLLDIESSARLIETPVPQTPTRTRPAARKTAAARTQSAKAAPRALAANVPQAAAKAPIHARVAAQATPATSPTIAPVSAETASLAHTPAQQSLLPTSLPIRAVVSAPPVSASASAPSFAFREPPSPLSPQARRAQAWERERARERISIDPDSRAGGLRKFL